MYILRTWNYRIDDSICFSEDVFNDATPKFFNFSNLEKRRNGFAKGKKKQSFAGKSSSIRDGACHLWQKECGISGACNFGNYKITKINMNRALILIMFDQYAITIGSSIAIRFIA